MSNSAYGNPVQVLIDRMAYHADPAQADRLLSGFKWFDRPLARPDGATDFPMVQLFLPDVSEDVQGQLVRGRLVVKLAVSTLKSLGIPALLDAVSAVLNAVETDTTGRVSPGLNGTLYQAMTLSAGNCFTTDLSLTAEVTIEMQPKAFVRGGR